MATMVTSLNQITVGIYQHTDIVRKNCKRVSYLLQMKTQSADEILNRIAENQIYSHRSKIEYAVEYL